VGLLASLLISLAGCATRSPVIATPERELPESSAAVDDIARMKRDPRPLARPVLVFSGWGDPGVVSLQLARDLAAVALDPSIETQQFFTSWTMDQCRRTAIEAAQKLTPPDHDPADGPFEIDVVGKSMGGLIARELARDQAAADDPVVRVVRIFTIATPHRGARMASWPTFDPKVVAMRPGSPFLAALDAELARDHAPEIVAYTRTGDWMVGEQNTAPVGGVVRVVPRPPLEFGHLQAGGDERILADIMRRLRGESPLLPDPAAD
jgi:pimeloyl-ACP methyl ester carboxylesterase